MSAIDDAILALIDSRTRKLKSRISAQEAWAPTVDEAQEALRAKVEAQDAVLAGLRAELDAIPHIRLSGITPTVTCDGTSCTVDIAWHSDPPSSGRVLWGPTEAYGNLTKPEPALLADHRQRLGTFPQDGATYHFRVLATTPELSGSVGATFEAGG